MKTVAFLIFWLFITLSFFYCKADNWPPVIKNDIGSALAAASINPYQVAILQRLRYIFDVLDGKRFVCSGSLINTQWVLTAAQCVANPNLRIMLGVNNILIHERFRVSFDVSAGDVIVHPRYNAEELENDIALIRLPQPVEYNDYIQPVSLDSNRRRHVNETVFLSGWGRISPFTTVSDYLRQTTLKIISNEDCQKEFLEPFFYIDCNQLCAVGELLFSEIGACAGDTGAPLIAFNSEKSRPEQIAVLSNPPFVCKGMQPTIHTKVSSYQSWIADVINQHGVNIYIINQHYWK